MTATVDNTTPTPARRRRRIFPWFFALVQILFLVWIIAGASSSTGSTAKSCTGLVGQALQTCHDAGTAGTALGVGLIIGLWAAVDVILAIMWMVLRMARRR